MFYMKAVSFEGMEKIKEGIYFFDCVDHQGNYRAYLECLMPHLVCALYAVVHSCYC